MRLVSFPACVSSIPFQHWMQIPIFSCPARVGNKTQIVPVLFALRSQTGPDKKVLVPLSPRMHHRTTGSCSNILVSNPPSRQ